jgi:hypothetical protein
MADIDHGVHGDAIHIQDCRVWSEIYYLDSPTDYREYLAENRVQPRSDLIMLENSKRPPKVNTISLRLLLAGIALVLVSGYLLCAILDLL